MAAYNKSMKTKAREELKLRWLGCKSTLNEFGVDSKQHHEAILRYVATESAYLSIGIFKGYRELDKILDAFYNLGAKP